MKDFVEKPLVCGSLQPDSARGYRRVTCSCGRAVVRQPWMNELNWKLAVENFTVEHAVSNKEKVK